MNPNEVMEQCIKCIHHSWGWCSDDKSYMLFATCAPRCQKEHNYFCQACGESKMYDTTVEVKDQHGVYTWGEPIPYDENTKNFHECVDFKEQVLIPEKGSNLCKCGSVMNKISTYNTHNLEGKSDYLECSKCGCIRRENEE